jgi:hypothetical protein
MKRVICQMETCPDCPGQTLTKKHGEATLSPGNFLDQIIYCRCGWCGVESTPLTSAEADEFRMRPKQLRMEI